MKKIDVEWAKDKYIYEPDTGKLIYKSDGRVATTLTASGYIRCGRFVGHRVAWAIHYGEDPAERVVDHIDHDKTNNRIDNLRLATPSQNKVNAKVKPRGIRKTPKGRWVARVRRGRGAEGEVWHQTFDCPLVAHMWYTDKRAEIFGEFC